MEGARRQIVGLIFITYWLLILEGAMRKWLFPQWGDALYFIRDPFVLAVYWLALRHRLWPRSRMFLFFALPVFCLGTLVVIVQLFTSALSPLLLICGWRNYFLYLPLIFVIGDQFRREDLERLIRQTLLAAIPISLLVVYQYYSPVVSFINRSVVSGVYYASMGNDAQSHVIRTIGTFTFFHGHQLFIASLILFVFLGWILPKDQRPLGGAFLTAATLASLVIFSLDYSRLPLFFAALILAGSLISGLIIKNGRMRLRAVLLPLLITGAIALFASVLFLPSQQLRMWRILTYGQGESGPENRLFRAFTRFVYLIPVTPALGYGIGLTSRGGLTRTEAIPRALDRKQFGEIWQERIFFYGRPVYHCTAAIKLSDQCLCSQEEEWTRILLETGPSFGLCFIAFRVSLVIYLILGAVRATRRSENPLPLLFALWIAPIFLIWYLTHIGSVQGYGFLFAGFSLAANHLSRKSAFTRQSPVRLDGP